MKIFVTGVAGLLGSNIARRLTKDHEIVGCDNLIGGLEDNIPTCDFHKIDILDTKAVIKAMDGCEMVLHTAALPYEGLSVFSPAIVTQNIVGGTVSVIYLLILALWLDTEIKKHHLQKICLQLL